MHVRTGRARRTSVSVRITEDAFRRLTLRAAEERTHVRTLGADLLEAVLSATASEPQFAPTVLRDLFEVSAYVTRLLEAILKNNPKVLGDARAKAEVDAVAMFGPRLSLVPRPLQLEPPAAIDSTSKGPSAETLAEKASAALIDRVTGPKR